jgi:hypothetical protein
MSQAGINNTLGGQIPPQIPTSFVTDNGTVIPSFNVVNVNGGSTSASSPNGILAIANPTGSNNLVIELTNRVGGTVQTGGATPTPVITFPLGTVPGVYTFDILVAGFAKAGGFSPLGCGFTIVGSVRTDGTTATLIPTQVVDHFEEGDLGAPPQVTAVLGVIGNNAVVNVTGKTGYTIDWNSIMNYVFVS